MCVHTSIKIGPNCPNLSFVELHTRAFICFHPPKQFQHTSVPRCKRKTFTVTFLSSFMLNIPHYIQFKIGLITYKILNQGQPVYLRELIHPYTSSRNTRRSTPKLKFLHTPTFNLRFINQSNFSPIVSVTMPWVFGTPSPSK